MSLAESKICYKIMHVTYKNKKSVITKTVSSKLGKCPQFDQIEFSGFATPVLFFLPICDVFTSN